MEKSLRIHRAPRRPIADKIKAGLLALPILLASLVLRVAEEEFTFAAEGWFLPPFAVWLGTFLFSLLFYPLQKKQKDGVRSLPLWAAISAGVGLIGVAIYGLENWGR